MQRTDELHPTNTQVEVSKQTLLTFIDKFLQPEFKTK